MGQAGGTYGHNKARLPLDNSSNSSRHNSIYRVGSLHSSFLHKAMGSSQLPSMHHNSRAQVVGHSSKQHHKGKQHHMQHCSQVGSICSNLDSNCSHMEQAWYNLGTHHSKALANLDRQRKLALANLDNKDHSKSSNRHPLLDNKGHSHKHLALASQGIHHRDQA